MMIRRCHAMETLKYLAAGILLFDFILSAFVAQAAPTADEVARTVIHVQNRRCQLTASQFLQQISHAHTFDHVGNQCPKRERLGARSAR